MPRTRKVESKSKKKVEPKSKKIEEIQPPFKIEKTGRGYYHSFDPFVVFDSEEKASENAKIYRYRQKNRSIRVPTFYTFLQDKRKNDPTEFTSIPQGPHTIPHHALWGSLVVARQKKSLHKFFTHLPTPENFDKVVDGEIDTKHAKRKRADLAKDYYKKQYKKAKDLSELDPENNDEEKDRKIASRLNKAFNVHPYATYAYKGRGASKKALKRKNENANLPVHQQLDFNPNVFTNTIEANKHVTGFAQFLNDFVGPHQGN